MTDTETERLILRVISMQHREKSLRHGGQYGLHDAVRNEAGSGDRPDNPQIMRGVWSLIGQGLAYLELLSAQSRVLEPSSYVQGPGCGQRRGHQSG